MLVIDQLKTQQNHLDRDSDHDPNRSYRNWCRHGVRLLSEWKPKPKILLPAEPSEEATLATELYVCVESVEPWCSPRTIRLCLVESCWNVLGEMRGGLATVQTIRKLELLLRRAHGRLHRRRGNFDDLIRNRQKGVSFRRLQGNIIAVNTGWQWGMSVMFKHGFDMLAVRTT